jgi:hypothetical protein
MFGFGKKNTRFTSAKTVVEQMNERRALPVGASEFDEWSDRIISGTLLPADSESMKFALATMILHLGPTESHKEDAYFIHALRKSAANQVAHAKMTEIRDAAKARLAAEEAAKLQASTQSEATLTVVGGADSETTQKA